MLTSLQIRLWNKSIEKHNRRRQAAFITSGVFWGLLVCFLAASADEAALK